MSAARFAPINDKTGEPRRPFILWTTLILSFAAIACVAVSLFCFFFVAVFDFNYAARLTNLLETELGSSWRILLAVGVTVVAIIIGVTTAISGFYAWAGYRWARIAALLTFALSWATLLLNIFAYPAIVLTFLAAILVWLPPSSHFFASWALIRHQEQVFLEPVTEVFYGPLPKYQAVLVEK